jgi:hypothetical protein
MHLDDEQIQRLLESAKATSVRSVADAHLAGCPECQRRVAEAEAEESRLFERFRKLDHPAPPMSARDVMIAGPRSSGWGRLAAGVVLAVATAGLAYAAPGSPVPRWIDRIIQSIAPAHSAPRQITPPGPAVPSHAGIAVEPGERFVIQLTARHTLDSAVVSLTDSVELTVRVRGGVTTFTSDVGRLGVVHAGASGILEIQVPQAAPSVELRVGGRRVWLKEGGQVHSDGSPDAQGRYRLGL